MDSNVLKLLPQLEAKRLGLEYIGHDIFYWFNDLETKSTIVIQDISDLEDKVNESRNQFGGE